VSAEAFNFGFCQVNPDSRATQIGQELRARLKLNEKCKTSTMRVKSYEQRQSHTNCVGSAGYLPDNSPLSRPAVLKSLEHDQERECACLMPV